MRFKNLFHDFTHSEKTGGLVLLGCTVLSMLLANSSFGVAYSGFWLQEFGPAVPGLPHSPEHWINDGLMTVFFLLVGLEIERELYIGELSSAKAAALPIAGAVGGMVVPALVYYVINRGLPTQNGFGVPMATDIAFSLGMLSLLGSRVPASLKIFLTALAIIDDLGAIFVIAIFYSNGISFLFLGLAAIVFAILCVMNRAKVCTLWLYLVLGSVLWYFMMRSGIHATLAGVLLAFAIPFHRHDEQNISYHVQHALHKPVAFIILPLFALANTAIILEPGWVTKLSDPNAVGILAGLVLGKPLGILAACFLLVQLNWGKIGNGLNWSWLAGAGLLAGIGFTMSIFIANLAFADGPTITVSKTAILVASFVAAFLGLVLLYFIAGRTKKQQVTG